MIRRAQAEALLKLAEALEECEGNGVEVQEDTDGLSLVINGEPHYPDRYLRLNGVGVRYAITKLYPKSEAE